MTIRLRLAALAALGILGSLIIGVVGWQAIRGLDEAARGITLTSRVLRLHVETDMLHEGFRGDAFAALAATSPAELDALQADWAARRHDLLEKRSQSQALAGGNPAVRAALLKVDAPFRQYVEDVGQLIATARGSNAAARQALPAVLAEFAALETSLDAASTEIQRANEEAAALATQRGASAVTWMLVAGGLGALVLALASTLLIRGVLRPLGRVVAFMEDLAEGEGDLTVRLNLAGRDELAVLAGAFDRFVAKLGEVLRDVQGSADEVSSLAGSLRASASELSTNASSNVSAIHETSASVQQLSATLKRSAANAGGANEVVRNASEVAARGGEAMRESVDSMQALDQSSRRIAEILETMDEIAFQTNLLALNASVEASRAGEQGRGFAVVAQEVRSLAQRAGAAARDSKRLIDDSVEQVGTSSGLVSAAGTTFSEIVTQVAQVTQQMGDIALASREGSLGVEEIERAVGQMERVTEVTAQGAQAVSSTALQLDERATSVRDLVGRFKLAA
jgi:methyl-accepting chemotaxis protein